MKLRPLLPAALLVFLSLPAFCAETAYVIDKLLVGVHQDKDLNSAIVKVLPTGTKLEVLQRDGELAEVRDEDGTSGWVDAAYLMEQAPAEIRVQTLMTENEDLRKKLAAGGSETPAAGDRDELAKENTDLKGKLSAAKLKVGELQATVGALEAKAAARPTTPADTVIAELEKENRKLARELEAAVQKNGRLESELDDRDPVIPVAINGFSTPVVVGLGVAFLLAFGGGVYFMDYLNRRRHGGFRI